MVRIMPKAREIYKPVLNVKPELNVRVAISPVIILWISVYTKGLNSEARMFIPI